MNFADAKTSTRFFAVFAAQMRATSASFKAASLPASHFLSAR